MVVLFGTINKFSEHVLVHKFLIPFCSILYSLVPKDKYRCALIPTVSNSQNITVYFFFNFYERLFLLVVSSCIEILELPYLLSLNCIIYSTEALEVSQNFREIQVPHCLQIL